MNKTYFKVAIENLDRSLEDQVVDLSFSFGAVGVSENLAFHQSHGYQEPQPVVRDPFDLDIFFGIRPEQEFLDSCLKLSPSLRISLVEEANKDWLSEWKKGFDKFYLSDGVWVVPSWQRQAIEPAGALFLDPGMAFGTGTHATTRLAMKLLGEGLRRHPQAEVLDVGTGTGILAMAAIRVGASRAWGVDNDAEALRVARENVELNQLTDRVIISENWPDSQSRWALALPTNAGRVVVANIIETVLYSIRSNLFNQVPVSGDLILSGILKEQVSDFRNRFFADQPGELLEIAIDGEWAAFHWAKSR